MLKQMAERFVGCDVSPNYCEELQRQHPYAIPAQPLDEAALSELGNTKKGVLCINALVSLKTWG